MTPSSGLKKFNSPTSAPDPSGQFRFRNILENLRYSQALKRTQLFIQEHVRVYKTHLQIPIYLYLARGCPWEEDSILSSGWKGGAWQNIMSPGIGAVSLPGHNHEDHPLPDHVIPPSGLTIDSLQSETRHCPLSPTRCVMPL